MRTLITLLTAGALSAGVAASPQGAPNATEGLVERPFAPGGQVTLDLSAGQYTIVGTDKPRVAARWKVSEPEKARDVEITAQVAGTQARLDVEGPSNGFHVEIEIPARSDLWVSLSAGDLTTRGLVGSQDVSAWAGKLVIGVMKPEAYKRVTASVTAGQIRSGPFQVDKGGIFRSISHDGPGQHTLRVRLTAGDVVFTSEEQPAPDTR